MRSCNQDKSNTLQLQHNGTDGAVAFVLISAFLLLRSSGSVSLFITDCEERRRCIVRHQKFICCFSYRLCALCRSCSPSFILFRCHGARRSGPKFNEKRHDSALNILAARQLRAERWERRRRRAHAKYCMQSLSAADTENSIRK